MRGVRTFLSAKRNIHGEGQRKNCEDSAKEKINLFTHGFLIGGRGGALIFVEYLRVGIINQGTIFPFRKEIWFHLQEHDCIFPWLSKEKI